MTLNVRPPAPSDEAAWRTLWSGYNHFYRATVPPDVTDALWQKLLSPTADITGLIAESDGEPIGLAHILFHPSSWSHQPSCYLEDLFVSPTARGTGAAAALIDAATTTAKSRNADRLYWHTQEFNAPARSLYDTLAQRTSFIMYRKEI